MAAGSKFEVHKVSGGRKGPILVKKNKSVTVVNDGLSWAQLSYEEVAMVKSVPAKGIENQHVQRWIMFCTR